jgi:hypothetical protein
LILIKKAYDFQLSSPATGNLTAFQVLEIKRFFDYRSIFVFVLKSARGGAGKTPLPPLL